MTKGAYCIKEIRSRSVIAKSLFTKKESLLTNNLSLKLRNKLIKPTSGALLFMGQKHGKNESFENVMLGKNKKNKVNRHDVKLRRLKKE